MTAEEFVNAYVASLQAAGRTLVRSRDVYAAGRAEGNWGRGVLRLWAGLHPAVKFLPGGHFWEIRPLEISNEP